MPLPPACRVLHFRNLRGLPVLVHGISRRAWGLRLRGTGRKLAVSLPTLLPSALMTASASRLKLFEALYPARLYLCLRFAVYLAIPGSGLHTGLNHCGQFVWIMLSFQ